MYGAERVIDISEKLCYKTVAHMGESLLVEKKSKFIASVMPVNNEDDAIAFINGIKSKYSDARHNVYAYVIDENNIFRYSDDGEPQGTAGMPVLDTIRKEGIVDAAVVVTRYFGGILLGTGGLVHAYGTAARQGLENAKIVMRTLCDVVAVKADYTLVGKIQYMISAQGYMLSDTVYDNDVTFFVCCKCADTQNFIHKVTDLTNARAVCNVIEQKFVDLE